MKLYKSFSTILSENNFSIPNRLQNFEKYFAHTRPDKNIEKYEKLHEHVELVRDVALDLIKTHNLEPIINRLITPLSFQNETVGNYIKLLFIDSIIFHDFGKINVNFQVEKMGNPFFKEDKSIKIDTQHSFLSAYIFLNYQLHNIYYSNELSSEEQSLIAYFVFLFTIPILKHHSSFIAKDYDFEIEKIQSIHQFLSLYGLDIDFELFSQPVIHNEQKIWQYIKVNHIRDSAHYFTLFAILKLNWSLLTAADYYATSEYMNGLKINDFGIINQPLRQQILHNIRTNKSYNRDLFANISKYANIDLKTLQTTDNQQLNTIRQKMGVHIISKISDTNDRLFYIEAPTGGGKTNLSMIAMSQLLKEHPEINKVFYVFPFTTLITQTYQSIIETLGLDEQVVTQLHSKGGFKEKESNKDGVYGKDLINFINNIFVNYPITLLTHIRFFDILKANDKSSNYLLHRLANSIVIIDEIQAYNPKHWDKIKYFITQYAKYFNIRFIVMSATLPKIGNIDLNQKETAEFIHLIPNAQKDYIQNPNFKNRVAIQTELLEKEEIGIQELARFIYQQSEVYANERSDKHRGSVRTVIEFIYKKSATEFYNTIQELELFQDYHIFVLSGTILEPRRKEIIAFLKDQKKFNKKVILITTQVVEAGVDIDMDIGFKNKSLLDSDEQLAGRINRNVNKQNCKLWIFDHNEPRIVYGKDPRFKVANRMSSTERKKILEGKNFDVLYDKVVDEIEKNNKSFYKENFSDYLENIESLNFQRVSHDFRLIESDNISIFVPVDVPISCYENQNNFTNTEIHFLRKHNCIDDANAIVIGESIWNLFYSLSVNQAMGFIQKSIELKKLNGIMSKFIFSIFTPKLESLKPYLAQMDNFDDYQILGFYKLNKSDVCNDLNGTEKIYNYISGLNDNLMDDSFAFF